MQVTLVNYTDRAREILILAKRTRQLRNAMAWQDVISLSEEEKIKELSYVFSTVGSSWEFVNYTLLLTGVTRAFTHQLVRHRTGISYAQQAQRVASMDGFEYLATGGCRDSESYRSCMDNIQIYYQKLLEEGISVQDARGVLPTNILTNILFCANLRTIIHILGVRLCLRAQGEFQVVAKAIRDKILEVHPWLDNMLLPYCLVYASCQWENFPDCPLITSVPSLDRRRNKWPYEQARKTWEEVSGTDFQPLVK